MLFGHLLTNRAQIFSDVRTYWSPEAVKRVTGKELTGLAQNGIIHLINSGATTLDGTGQQTDANGNPAMKPSWEITESEVENAWKQLLGIRPTETISVEVVSLLTSCQRGACLSP